MLCDKEDCQWLGSPPTGGHEVKKLLARWAYTPPSLQKTTF
jgi:hypothetical protein